MLGMLSEDEKLASKSTMNFETFGEKAEFALEIALLPGSNAAEPEESEGSWGAWRLWVAGVNLCDIRLHGADGNTSEVQEVRWFLAPFFRWLIDNWMPLIHEKRLPQGGAFFERRSYSARDAYLAMLESAGDDPDRFYPWQVWAGRHSLRSASEGGILPDVFFQRMEDEIEMSWGNRIQPGAEAAMFMADGGVARASVNRVADALASAIDWYLKPKGSAAFMWIPELVDSWTKIKVNSTGISAVSWYLDSSPEPDSLTKSILNALKELKKPLQLPETPWLGTLSPEVAMFGDLSPNTSNYAAAKLLAEYFEANSGTEDSDALKSLVSEQPAWMYSSPWSNGYALALEVLEEIDPKPKDSESRIETMLENLGVRVKEVNLGKQGPRGVALAGDGLQPTILVNLDHLRNKHRGKRFTMAHEFCHILFDRTAARPLTHTSTPWASPAVEQRANAFAAMLLMPPKRAKLPPITSRSNLKIEVAKLANRMKVSRAALRQHLVNINEISQEDIDSVSPL